MGAIRQFLKRIRTKGVRRAVSVTTVAMGRTRVFDAYDVGDDTYVFERGIAAHLKERPSVLVVEKCSLGRRVAGRVMTMTTGNHSVAAFPLLDGRFWKLSRVPSARRGETLMNRILCVNVVNDTIEISQREIPTPALVRADDWLLSAAGFWLSDIVMGERNDQTIEHYRRLGQEWRVKPLAWTQTEMKVALAASRKRIATSLSYFHSTRGVHLLTYPEFSRFAALAQTDPEAFVRGLRELVSVFEGNRFSFARMPKYRGHHEIEFFGLRRGTALERLIPELEKLMEAIALSRLGQLGVIQRIQEIVALYASLLAKPELADETSKTFVETVYMYVTGEIYFVVGEGSTPAFDDRRTALPGATFVNGRPVMQPGSDERTELLMSNLRGLMSKDEIIEYANVYELRGEDSACPLGRGSTREIVYKTSKRPLENSMVEKRLSRAARGYSGYMLARIGALRALGIALSDFYMLLRHRPGHGPVAHDYYIRRRCEGEPMETIPETYFRSVEDGSVEDRDVVLRLAALLGDAAAQNLAMKKYDPVSKSTLFGIGKEIYEFEYDITRERVVPKKVATCSIRGSFGWPCLDHTPENLQTIADVYLTRFAAVLRDFGGRHAVPLAELAESFFGGFEFRTHALAWQLSVMRDKFEVFTPELPSAYQFGRKWRFVMWSLERQERRLPLLKRTFLEKLGEVS